MEPNRPTAALAAPGARRTELAPLAAEAAPTAPGPGSDSPGSSALALWSPAPSPVPDALADKWRAMLQPRAELAVLRAAPAAVASAAAADDSSTQSAAAAGGLPTCWTSGSRPSSSSEMNLHLLAAPPAV